MSDESVIVARPARLAALVLLFHGFGSSADNLVPLAPAVARAAARLPLEALA